MQPETLPQGSSLQTSAVGHMAEKTTLLQLDKTSANRSHGAATAKRRKRRNLNRAHYVAKSENQIGASPVLSSSSSAPMTRGETQPPQNTTIPSLQKRGRRSKKGHGRKTGKTNILPKRSCCHLLTENSAIFRAKLRQASTPSKEHFQQSLLTSQLAHTYYQCAVAVLVVGVLCFFSLIWLITTNSTQL